MLKRILCLGIFLVLFVGAKFIYFEMGGHRDYCMYYWENYSTCSTEVSRAQTILIADAWPKLCDKTNNLM